MIKRELKEIWEQLRSQKPTWDTFLDEVHIKGIHGISDLRIPFDYPVSVIAGQNACGKSTILSTLACAYKNPETDRSVVSPSLAFPHFIAQPIKSDKSDESDKANEANEANELNKSKESAELNESDKSNESADSHFPCDERNIVEIVYSYLERNKRRRMRWRRQTKSWNRTFFGEQKAKQPQREVYLHHLPILNDPSEVRSVLQRYLKADNYVEIDSALLAFAYRILPFRYQNLQSVSAGKSEKDILFAYHENTDNQYGYSEFHMSVGERAILHLSKDISRLKNALILIDGIEADLHPYTQQKLMLELQHLALRNQLQIVVTTHSPVVLDTVPVEGRIFLERTESNVERCPPYRDIIQKSLYGKTQDKLSILCENTTVEGIVLGVFDYLNTELELRLGEVEMACDIGREEFPNYAKTLAQFHLINNFIFVLKGDASTEIESDIAKKVEKFGQTPQILSLVKAAILETWAWQKIEANVSEYAKLFKIQETDLQQEMQHLDKFFEAAVDTQANIAKRKFAGLCGDSLKREVSSICRIVARQEAARGELHEFVISLKDVIIRWRSL
ncbi:AAA family ATPase [Candidatus Parabeggiatoa sp. HSG14]|uniref:AAA family ATPase n=1 Tax=Candidatus Parabeggiatoa sp. HSG14 TaxID=3055593 RepID=UPI0025A74310|nr:AAA family ATPase [Thiotrichales bacterium HSG14]